MKFIDFIYRIHLIFTHMHQKHSKLGQISSMNNLVEQFNESDHFQGFLPTLTTQRFPLCNHKPRHFFIRLFRFLSTVALNMTGTILKDVCNLSLLVRTKKVPCLSVPSLLYVVSIKKQKQKDTVKGRRPMFAHKGYSLFTRGRKNKRSSLQQRMCSNLVP